MDIEWPLCNSKRRRCGQDLRKRVMAFVRGGGSKAEAARRFQVSRSSVYNWTSAPDGLAYERPGPKGPRHLDWGGLRTHVAEQPDATQKERARHFGVSRHCIWYALQRMELSRKKNAGVQGARPAQKKGVPAATRTLSPPR
jgi:transposase